MNNYKELGKINMINVSNKETSLRLAKAHARVLLDENTFKQVIEGKIEKGDIFATAKIAGIIAAKKTDEIIPLCHPLNLTYVNLVFYPKVDPPSIEIESEVSLIGRTGAEMESLMAVSIAALTIYDMCKSIDKTIEIDQVFLIEKSGGETGHFIKGKE
jgi:cyclic pyranopterin phosphate synthase